MGMRQLRILQLSASVANQISAGEVIERPASVVKELLENALDAGADAISIEIGYGGLNQIKISDNGSGIFADDLPLAITAHATSKIVQLNDLYALNSMGFRGEALASIAAVSRLSLSSKPHDQEHAMMLRFDGKASSLSPCARSQGTTVEVLDLFFNAPVRKKFLKTVRSEYLAIEMVVKRFALSAPTIALTLKNDGKQVLVLPGAHSEKTRLLRIRKLLGKLFIENAIPVDVEQGGVRLLGWVSGQAYQRSQNDKQWVYINQRMVKDKLINHAIKRAYEGLLHPGRSPACVLYLSLAAQDVDVNVHPTKHEVRFQQPRLIHDFILSHLSEALVPQAGTMTQLTSVPQNENFSSGLSLVGVNEVYNQKPLCAVARVEKSSTTGWFVLNTQFALVFLQEESYLVDIEGVQQHRLLSLLMQQSYPLTRRPLLLPVSYTIDKTNSPLFNQYQPVFSQLGLELDLMGDTKVVVRSIPVLFPQLDLQKFLQSITSPSLSQSALLKLLVVCQSYDAYQLDTENKELLIDYLQQQVKVGPLVSLCRCLDTEQCREIMSITK